MSRPISRILSRSIIYLCGLPLSESERAALCAKHPEIYMALQSARRTANCVATKAGELLLHLLTLILVQDQNGYFLLRYYTFTGISRFGRAVPCTVRTFLPAKAERQISLLATNVTKLTQKIHEFSMIKQH